MSQAKVEQRKNEKLNRKKTMAKEKAKHTAAMVCVWAVIALLLVWIGYTGYNYWESRRPVKSIYTNTSAISDYMNSLNTQQQ